MLLMNNWRPDRGFPGVIPHFSLCLFWWLTLLLSSSGPSGPAEVEGPSGPGHGHSGPATTRQWRGDSQGEVILRRFPSLEYLDG